MKEVWENRDRTELKTPDSIKTFLCVWFTHLFRKEKVWTKFTPLEVNIYVNKRLQKSPHLTAMVYEDPAYTLENTPLQLLPMECMGAVARCPASTQYLSARDVWGKRIFSVTLLDSRRLLILQAQKAELDARHLALSALLAISEEGRSSHTETMREAEHSEEKCISKAP